MFWSTAKLENFFHVKISCFTVLCKRKMIFRSCLNRNSFEYNKVLCDISVYARNQYKYHLRCPKLTLTPASIADQSQGWTYTSREKTMWQKWKMSPRNKLQFTSEKPEMDLKVLHKCPLSAYEMNSCREMTSFQYSMDCKGIIGVVWWHPWV